MGYSVDFISDRQDLKVRTKARLLGLEPWMMDRTDMFWVKYKGPEGNFTWAVDSYPEGRIELSPQHSKPTVRQTKSATQYFLGTRQYKQMLKWSKELEGEYIPWPGPLGGSERCSLCGSCFIKGSKHEHFVNECGVFPYGGRELLEKEKELGVYDGSWAPGYGKDTTPSLEDMGATPEVIRTLSKDEPARIKFLKSRKSRRSKGEDPTSSDYQSI